MSLDVQPETTILTEHERLLWIVEIQHDRIGIGVQINDVAHSTMEVTTRCRVDDARGILLAGKVDHLSGLELSPTLVERCPHDDARIVVMLCNHIFPLVLEGIFSNRRQRTISFVPLTFQPISLATHLNAGHILPHEHAEAVAVVVPTCRFDLHVLTNGVESPRLRLLDVEAKGLIGGSSVDAVGPVALVQRA